MNNGLDRLQVEAARLFSKYAARIPSLNRVPFFVEKVMFTVAVADKEDRILSTGSSFVRLLASGCELFGPSW